MSTPGFIARCRRAPTSALRLLRDVGAHWGTALFSVAAAMGIWVAIQDVDNPRVDGRGPASGGIEVEAVNVPDGFLVESLPSVIVRVEARKDDLASLRPGDFKAEVDVGSLKPDSETNRVPVRVESRRGGVSVIDVIPSTVEVRLVKAGRLELTVTPRVTDPPPSGYRVRRLDDRDVAPRLEPPLVTVSGPANLVERVRTVELAVNLAAARTDNYSAEGDLVARSEDGNVVDVTLSVRRARATFQVEQVFSSRTVGLQPRTTGRPAAGFVVVDIVVDPAVIEVTGPKAIIDALRGPLSLEEVDLTGAKQTITVTKSIERPSNVSTERQTAVVRIEVRAVDQAATVFVAVTVEAIPTGLTVDVAPLTVQIRISGTVAAIAALKPTDLKAIVSLAGAVVGINPNLLPRVTGPPGIRIESVDPIAVTLKSLALP